MSLLFCIVSVYVITIYCKCVRANKILFIVYCLKKPGFMGHMRIFNDMINTGWDSFRPIGLLVVNKAA